MKKVHLLNHINTYHATKSNFRKKFPGDQNTYPRVSKEVERVIGYLNLIPGDSLSDNDFSRLMVLISHDPALSPTTKQTFKAISDGVISHHSSLEKSAATAVKKEEPVISTELRDAVSGDKPEELKSKEVDAEEDQAALQSNAQEEEEQEERDEEGLEEAQEERDEKVLEEAQEEEDVEEEELVLSSEDEEDRAASELIPPTPHTTPNPSPQQGPLKRSLPSETLHDMLPTETKTDVEAASSDVPIASVLSPTSGEHLIPPGSSTKAFTLVTSATTNHSDSKVEPNAYTPLLSATPSLSYTTLSYRPPSGPSYWANFKRAAAFGLTMGSIDFVGSYSNDERLTYKTARALSVAFIYSVLSYNTENSSSLMLMASLFHSGINFYFNAPASLYNSATSLFGRALITGASQGIWNRLISDDPEPGSPSVSRVHR